MSSIRSSLITKPNSWLMHHPLWFLSRQICQQQQLQSLLFKIAANRSIMEATNFPTRLRFPRTMPLLGCVSDMWCSQELHHALSSYPIAGNTNCQQSASPPNITVFTNPMSPTCQFHHTNPVSKNLWDLGSGVTYHITFDLNNIALHQPCNRDEEVLIGDGSSLTISSTSSSSLPSLSYDLSLNNVLHVLENPKNLIFLYLLCNANKIFVEF